MTLLLCILGIIRVSISMSVVCVYLICTHSWVHVHVVECPRDVQAPRHRDIVRVECNTMGRRAPSKCGGGRCGRLKTRDLAPTHPPSEAQHWRMWRYSNTLAQTQWHTIEPPVTCWRNPSWLFIVQPCAAFSLPRHDRQRCPHPLSGPIRIFL